jgi:ASC-1-like (ASCH) protein
MKLGLTNILGGVSTAGFHDLLEGDVVTCTNDELGCERTFTIQITHIRMYDTIQLMVMSEGVEKCLPSVDTIDQAIQYYQSIYTQDQIANYFGKAIEFVLVK